MLASYCACNTPFEAAIGSVNIDNITPNDIMGQTITKTNVMLDGHCDKEYEPVKKHVEKMLKEGIEENLQLCVYVDEKCVVDLYGTAVGDKTYNADTIQVC